MDRAGIACRLARLRALLEVRRDAALAGLVLIYFGARLGYFATQIHPAIPPDEITHVGRIVAYSKAVLIPSNSPETFEHGLVNHSPFLYYVVMGKLLRLNVLPLSDVVFLRLANAGLGLLTGVYAYRWMGLLTDREPARLLFLTLFTNTLMFTAVCASVTYDTPANLLAVMAMYYLFRFFRNQTPSTLAATVLCASAGCLTKETFLPLALIMALLLVAREWKHLDALPRGLRALFTDLRSVRAILYGLAMVSLALNVGLYGGNLLRYGRLVPRPDQVYGVENALKNRIFARGYVVGQYRDGRLTYDEAARLAAETITHAGDLADTQALLKIAQEDRLRKLRMDRVLYAAAWTHLMLHGTLGYMGHAQMPKSTVELYVYLAIVGIAVVVMIRCWRPSEQDWSVTCAAIIGVAYALVLLWLVNYPAYVQSGGVGIGVQGRYLFPVIATFWGLTAHYLLAYTPRDAEVPIALAVSAWFVYGDLPFFLRHATAEWFMSS